MILQCLTEGAVGECSTLNSLGSVQVLSLLVVWTEFVKAVLLALGVGALGAGATIAYLLTGGWRR